PKTLENGEMHIADMAHDTSNPNPGDLIEIKRQGYQHWALYVGDGYVIHVTAAGLLCVFQLWAFLCGKMHIPEIPHEKCHPSPGDLMEIKWQGFQHWALYVGDGYVIHVTAADGKGPPKSDTTGIIFTRKAKVKVRKNVLRELAGDDDWYVNNKHDWYCTPLPVEEIIERAESWIDKVMPYDELGSNFERFMTKLRYGDAISSKVSAPG
ncbi:phospholipase A and acyltransferase 1-like, partial [Malurus melanocephalus]|uniref:phospholipase A and acyltransferase 1-like n=1 Tax=Malurus melanocephalus TaxID=175006 RepID=UPI002546D439